MPIINIINIIYNYSKLLSFVQIVIIFSSPNSGPVFSHSEMRQSLCNKFVLLYFVLLLLFFFRITKGTVMIVLHRNWYMQLTMDAGALVKVPKYFTFTTSIKSCIFCIYYTIRMYITRTLHLLETYAHNLCV